MGLDSKRVEEIHKASVSAMQIKNAVVDKEHGANGHCSNLALLCLFSGGNVEWQIAFTRKRRESVSFFYRSFRSWMPTSDGTQTTPEIDSSIGVELSTPNNASAYGGNEKLEESIFEVLLESCDSMWRNLKA